MFELSSTVLDGSPHHRFHGLCQNCTLSPSFETLDPLQTRENEGIKLVPFQMRDCEPAAELYERCFANDALCLKLMPPERRDPCNPLAERQWRISTFQMALSLPGNHIIKAVDTAQENKIVGAAAYFAPGGVQWAVADHIQEAGLNVHPSFFDSELRSMVVTTLKEKRERVLKGCWDVWELNHIFVDPEYQRQGIGRRLLQRGCDLSDRDRKWLYIEGTLDGKRLYETAGCVVEDEAQYSGITARKGEPYQTFFMLRRPKGDQTWNKSPEKSADI